VSRFPALAHPQFRRYFAGQAGALVGGFAANMAMGWLAYRLTGSVALLGALGFALLAPALVVSPLAGLLADRYPRRRMLMGLMVLMALNGLALAALTATDRITPGLLLLLAALRGLAFAAEIPVRHAFLGDLVTERTALPNAVALYSSLLNTARFAGPALGGLLIGAVGEAACFLLHPALLLVAFVQLHRIRTDEAHVGQRSGHSFARQYAEGWQYAFSHPVIAPMLVGLFALGFGVGPYVHLMPAAVAALHGAHPELVGLFLSFAGLGAMAAAMTLAARRGGRHFVRIALGGNLAAAAGLALFSVSGSVTAGGIGMVLVGLGTIAQAVSTNITIQTHVPDDKRGRVMSIYTVMFLGATPLGSLFFGQVGQWTGAPQALLGGAAVAALGAALTAVRRRRA